MEIVGSTRTDVFVTLTVGNDPEKVCLSASASKSKPNHQSTQNSGRGRGMSSGGHSAKLAPQAARSLDVTLQKAQQAAGQLAAP